MVHSKKPTVAIMQPYFIPYAGYFRLLAASDIFVVYDCVQFPRRGWVHRNRMTNNQGEPQWLTLPLQRSPQDALINELQFRENAAEYLKAEAKRFPALTKPDQHGMLDALHDLSGKPVDYIERLLHRAAGALGLRWNTLRSSTLNIPREVNGQERILAIAKTLNAGCYVNAPGGRTLYDHARFNDDGIDLRFLPDFSGNYHSILERVLTDRVDAIAQEITANTELIV
jgi:hypothetical protein